MIVGTVSYEANNAYSSGQVIKQSPTAYTSIAKNTAINLTVSLGPQQTVTMTFNLTDSQYGVSINDTIDIKITISDDVLGTENAVTTFEQSDYKVTNENKSIKVQFTGAGTKYYQIAINGTIKATGKVKFQ